MRIPSGPAIRGRRKLAVAAVLAVLLLFLAACGTSGSGSGGATASPSGSGGTSAYINCLLHHTGGGGARKACKSLVPAGGLSSVFQAFTKCLHAHGVTLQGVSPEGKGAYKAIRQLESGSSSQRSALKSCITGLG